MQKEYLTSLIERIAPIVTTSVNKEVLRWNASRTALERSTITKVEKTRQIHYEQIPIVLEELREKVKEIIQTFHASSISDCWFTHIVPFDKLIEKELTLVQIYKSDSDHDEFAKQIYTETVIVPRIMKDDTMAIQDKFRFLNQPFFHWNNKYAQFHEILRTIVLPDIQAIKFETNLQTLVKNFKKLNELAAFVRDEKKRDELKEEIYTALRSNLEIAKENLKSPFSISQQIVNDLNYILPIYDNKQHSELVIFIADIISKQLEDKPIADFQHALQELTSFRQLLHVQKALFLGISRPISNDKHIEAFSKEFDAIMRSKEENESLMKTHLQLIPYFKDKDVLIVSIQFYMARRLLSNSSNALEEPAMSIMKMHFGTNEIMRLETMYKDIMSKEPYISGKNTMKTLNTASWSVPAFNHIPSWNMPERLKPIVDSFGLDKEKRYTFIPAHDSMQLEAKFGSKTYQLQMTSIQASVLFLFETADTLNAEAISTAIGAPIHITHAILHSLTMTKVPLLRYSQDTKLYELRDKIDSPLTLIKIPTPPYAIKKEVQKEQVELNRKYVIDAAIVRIMKSRKQMTFQELIGEIIRQMSHMFQPQPSQIKKSIEELIDREYLERVDTASLRYI